MVIGVVLAVYVLSSTILSYLFGFSATLVHELGHSIGGWLFGYPSVPAFDFFYGGGVTVQYGRVWPLACVVAAVIVWYMYQHRRQQKVLLALTAVLLLYILLALTPAHQGLILAMGHGAELLFVGMLLYLAMKRVRAGRLLSIAFYAFLGAFILLDNIRFSYLLAFSEVERHHYEKAGAIGFQMDFSRLSQDFLHISVTTIAIFFMVLCLLTPLASYLALRVRRRTAV
jgi:hypothetical protein